MLDKPKLLRSDSLYESKHTKLVKDVLEFEGKPMIREMVVRPNASVIVAINPQECIAFVKQYRHPADDFLLELPAGKIDEDEEPIVCADRELQEEVGVKANILIPLGSFYASPGYSTERLFVFRGHNLTNSKLEGDEEQIEVYWLNAETVINYVREGRICDSKSIAALSLNTLIPFYHALPERYETNTFM